LTVELIDRLHQHLRALLIGMLKEISSDKFFWLKGGFTGSVKIIAFF
jgi:hypothetical protein